MVQSDTVPSPLRLGAALLIASLLPAMLAATFTFSDGIFGVSYWKTVLLILCIEGAPGLFLVALPICVIGAISRNRPRLGPSALIGVVVGVFPWITLSVLRTIRWGWLAEGGSPTSSPLSVWLDYAPLFVLGSGLGLLGGLIFWFVAVGRFGRRAP